jgi:predicted enzyme related to lactoylglutathione lyase
VDYRVFSIGGKTVCGASQMAPGMLEQGVPSAWYAYIVVDDVDAALARAIELGATLAMPATPVGTTGRFAAIVDPTGAAVFLWHNTAPDPNLAYGEPGTLSWCDLTTRDPEKAADFYSKLVGWEVRQLEGGGMPYWQVMVDGQGQGGIMPMPDMVPPEVPAYWLDYFATTDIDASVARAKALGGTAVVEPPKVGAMLWFAVVEDPGGATFALLQPLGM